MCPPGPFQKQYINCNAIYVYRDTIILMAYLAFFVQFLFILRIYYEKTFSELYLYIWKICLNQWAIFAFGWTK